MFTPPQKPEAHEPPHTALVVEGDRLTRKLMCFVLDAHGYATEVAISGSQALMKAGTRQYDLVLVDLALPDMPGLDLVRRLRRASVLPETPIITTATEADDCSRSEALAAGSSDHLIMPLSRPWLASRLGGGTADSPGDSGWLWVI